MKSIVLLGAGGCARDVLDIFDACNQDHSRYDVIGYIVDEQYGAKGTIINDKPILGSFEWIEKYADKVYCVCAIGSPYIRRSLVRRVLRLGTKFLTVIHPSAILTKRIIIGEGCVIAAGCIFTNQIKLGNHVHVNLGSTVSHDGVLEDYVTLSPGVHFSGNVWAKEGSFVGTGTNIIENISIGEWSIIGAGSTIIENIPANSTVVGVPGKVIKKQENGWCPNDIRHN